MPICNGIQATREIRKYLRENVPYEQAKTYICGISSIKDKQYTDEAIASGMDSLITKPIFKIGMQTLLSKVSI